MARPAGTPEMAEMTGPTAMTIPVLATSSPSAMDRKNGPTTRVAIITVATSTFMASAVAIARPNSICRGSSGACDRCSTTMKAVSAAIANGSVIPEFQPDIAAA